MARSLPLRGGTRDQGHPGRGRKSLRECGFSRAGRALEQQPAIHRVPGQTPRAIVPQITRHGEANDGGFAVAAEVFQQRLGRRFDPGNGQALSGDGLQPHEGPLSAPRHMNREPQVGKRHYAHHVIIEATRRRRAGDRLDHQPNSLSVERLKTQHMIRSGQHIGRQHGRIGTENDDANPGVPPQIKCTPHAVRRGFHRALGGIYMKETNSALNSHLMSDEPQGIHHMRALRQEAGRIGPAHGGSNLVIGNFEDERGRTLASKEDVRPFLDGLRQ